MAPDVPTRESPARRVGPLPERVTADAPTVERLTDARLGELGSELLDRPVMPGAQAALELSARHPYDDARGNVDVYRPGRWETTDGGPGGLMYMEAVRHGPQAGEWEGSVAYVEFRPPSSGTYLVVGHFTGYQTTMHLNGPWGESTAYTPTTSDSGAVTAFLAADGTSLNFTLHCEAPDNGWGMGYIESIQVYELT